MNIPIKKLKAVLLYFTSNTDVKYLGKVKLMKLIYFLDFMHLKTYGTPVTYDTYINLEHGPIPSFIKNLVDNAADDIDSSILSDTIAFERPAGTKMFRVLPKRSLTEKDEKLFTETELDILQKVCIKYGNKNTQYVEDASHKEAPWKKPSQLQPISYTLAADDPDCKGSREEIELAVNLLS